jgi:hypothetical protein
LPHNTQSQGTGPWPDLVVRGFAGCRFHLREGTSVSGGTLMGLAKFVFFLAVLEFELRASCLEDRRSTT